VAGGAVMGTTMTLGYVCGKNAVRELTVLRIAGGYVRA
jgi:hypothetical protein